MTRPYGTQGYPVHGCNPDDCEESRLKTVVTGHSIPGRLVVRDTDDNHVTIAGNDAADVQGWIVPSGTHDTDTDYASEECLKIGYTDGTIVPLTLITGQTVTKGQVLSPAANGMLKSSASDPNPKLAVCRAWESVTTGTLASAPILVKWGV